MMPQNKRSQLSGLKQPRFVLIHRSAGCLGPGLRYVDLLSVVSKQLGGGEPTRASPGAMVGSETHRDRKQDGGCKGSGEVAFNGDRVSV